MQRFENIDPKLIQFAEEHHGQIRKDGFYFGDKPDENIEVRTIFWKEGVIVKDLSIHPLYDSGTSDDSLWTFVISAHYSEDDERYPHVLPSWHEILLRDVKLVEIENQLDRLLKETAEKLGAIGFDDLIVKPFFTS